MTSPQADTSSSYAKRESLSSRLGFLQNLATPFVAAAMAAFAPQSASAVERSQMQQQYELFKDAMYRVNAGQFEQAEQLYTSIIDQFTTPTSRLYAPYRTLLARAYSDRGNTRMTLQRCDQALIDYSHALSLEPNYPEFWVNRALAYGM
jgi:tetratricopeptide (TPR) repeat protein